MLEIPGLVRRTNRLPAIRVLVARGQPGLDDNYPGLNPRGATGDAF